MLQYAPYYYGDLPLAIITTSSTANKIYQYKNTKHKYNTKKCFRISLSKIAAGCHERFRSPPGKSKGGATAHQMALLSVNIL